MSRIHGTDLSFLLLLIQSALCCNPVYEFESRNIEATNSSPLIGYQLPPCPTLYRLSSVINAVLSIPASPQSNALSITDLLTAKCLGRNASPCTVDIPLQGLNVPAENTTLNVKVNYTCQLEDPGSIQSLIPTMEMEISKMTWVKYIRVKLNSARMDWKCTISSSGGSTVSWSWILKQCTASAFGCMSWMRTLETLPRLREASLLCMEPRSTGTIWVMADKFCPAVTETIAFDIQVPPASDFDIACNPETPSNNAANIENLNDPQLDPLKSECSQLSWTTLQSPTPKDLSVSTSGTTPAGNSETSITTLNGSSDTSVRIEGKAEERSYTTKTVSSLGLGLGLGLGLLVVVGAVALAVVCIRRNNRGYDAKNSTLSNDRAIVGGATDEKDGGFVLATDVFVVKNIYSEISEVNHNPNPSKPIQNKPRKSCRASDINKRNGVEGYNNSQEVPRNETAEHGFDQEPPPPAATTAPPGDSKPKRATSLSRKLFKQIAVLAKKEELKSQISKEGVARERPEEAAEMGGSELSIVDRWLYSSNVNSAENTLNQNRNDNDAIYLNRRFEIDI